MLFCLFFCCSKERIMYIKQDQRVLLLHKGDYRRLLPGGNFMALFGKTESYSVSEEFVPRSAALEIVLQNKEIAEQLEVVKVADEQLVLHFEDGIFKSILKP